MQQGGKGSVVALGLETLTPPDQPHQPPSGRDSQEIDYQVFPDHSPCQGRNNAHRNSRAIQPLPVAWLPQPHQKHWYGMYKPD